MCPRWSLVGKHGHPACHLGKAAPGPGVTATMAGGQVHSRMLAEYKLTADDVPLLQLRPDNWDEPFCAAPQRPGGYSYG